MGTSKSEHVLLISSWVRKDIKNHLSQLQAKKDRLLLEINTDKKELESTNKDIEIYTRKLTELNRKRITPSWNKRQGEKI
jgi:peptidoglycan hydrolase CwlO-like protein